MSAPDLAQIGPGFSDASLGSQAVFRAALQALSHPGRPFTVTCDAHSPDSAHRAAGAVLLAMLDADCTVWLSPRHASGNAAWLRFHTGCTVVASPHEAGFVWVAQGDAMPRLDALAQGSDAYPDQSATCVLETAGLDTQDGPDAWVLSGPGIQSTTRLRAHGLAADFAAQWSANHGRVPRGVDVLLTSAECLVGLPRTTRISTAEGR
jgi:alpha-D-ribose 1-methylphosphonate 5-triphosphate synthase subunit PhnH